MRRETAEANALKKNSSDAIGHKVTCAIVVARLFMRGSRIIMATACRRRCDFTEPNAKIKSSKASGVANVRPRAIRVKTSAKPPTKVSQKIALLMRTDLQRCGA